MSECDIDQLIDGILEWDFAIVIDGRRYKTKPLAVSTVAAIQKLGADLLNADLEGTVASLFDVPPPVSSWRVEQMFAVIEAVLAYWKAVMIKNFQSVSKRIRDGKCISLNSLPAC